MFLNTVKWAGAAVLVCGLAFTGVGVMARQNAKAKKDAGTFRCKPVADNAAPKSPSRDSANQPIATTNSDSRDDLPTVADLQRELRKAAQLEWRAGIQRLPRDEHGTGTGRSGFKAVDGSPARECELTR